MAFRKFLARRRPALVGLVLSAVAVALVLLAPASSEATKCGLEFRYYSDPGLTNLVGVRYYEPTACGCTLYSWGQLSVYREILDTFC